MDETIHDESHDCETVEDAVPPESAMAVIVKDVLRQQASIIYHDVLKQLLDDLILPVDKCTAQDPVTKVPCNAARPFEVSLSRRCTAVIAEWICPNGHSVWKWSSQRDFNGVQLPSLSPALTPHIKEEHNIKQEEDQLQVSAPDFSAVSVKTEESSLLQQRDTEQRDDTQGEDIKAETHGHFEDAQGEDVSAEIHVYLEAEGDTEHFSDMDSVEDWRPTFRSSPAHMDTGADGDHHNQEIRTRTVNNGDMSGTGERAKNRKHKCSVCKKRFESNYKLERHWRVHTGEEPFSCSVCKRTFAQQCNLKKHMSTHTGEKPFSCSVCKKTFAQQGNLKKHMHTHTGEEPFSCSVCKRRFAQQCNLKKHMSVHTGEKPFSCSVCKKPFARKSYLDAHMRTHTGEKPFRCSYCKNRYAQKSYLDTHMRTHTGEKLFSCSVCKKTFAQKSYLKPHMRTHTGEKPFSCSVCEKVFAVKSNLKTHMWAHHSHIEMDMANTQATAFQVGSFHAALPAPSVSGSH